MVRKNPHSDISPRLGWFTLAVIIVMIALGVVPQFERFGLRFERVDILSELRENENEVVEKEADI